jgi:hypothetical protein
MEWTNAWLELTAVLPDLPDNAWRTLSLLQAASLLMVEAAPLPAPAATLLPRATSTATAYYPLIALILAISKVKFLLFLVAYSSLL